MGAVSKALFIFFSVLLIIVVLFNREVTMDFKEEITSTLPRDMLWQELETVIKNSSQSDIWPDDMVKVRSEGLKENATINVTYKILFREQTYSYVVSNLHEKYFTYSTTEDHPIKGYATFRIHSKEGITTLRWYGIYKVKIFSAGSFYLRYYITMFFKELEKNIRELEEGQSTI
ncbi:hypothetical protein AYK26_03710 [Euryarchaeota archaeon SM23-78]|nr:MAG: hypothetical protein AYK26_03710 [Euryarchaeota archaeon SM23-78]MBW3000661.1 hypothetical protein [Candidatus Woesearchaeota archaeon]